MGSQLSFFVQVFLLVLLAFIYQKKVNQSYKVEPRIKIFENILNTYYDIYFYKFNKVGNYPQLGLIYKEMVIECSNNKIDLDIIRQSLESSGNKQNKWLSGVGATFVAFWGATQLTSLLDSVKNVEQFIESHKELMSFKEIFQQLVPSNLNLIIMVIVILFSITIFIFIIRIENESNIIQFSREGQITYIIKDFIKFWETELEQELDQSNYRLLTQENRELFNIRIIQESEAFALYIPANLSEDEKNKKEKFENNSQQKKELKLDWKNQKYVFLFENENNIYELVSIKKSDDNEEICEEELKKIKVIFEILFEYAKLTKLSQGKVSSVLSLIIIWVNNLQWTIVRWFLLTVIFLVFLIFILTIITLILLSMVVNVFYMVFIIYLCYQIATWLLKRVH